MMIDVGVKEKFDWRNIPEDNRISKYALSISKKLDRNPRSRSITRSQDLIEFGRLCHKRDKGTLDQRLESSFQDISELINKISCENRNTLTLEESTSFDYLRCEHLQSLIQLKAVECLETGCKDNDTPFFEFIYLYHRLRNVCGGNDEGEDTSKRFLYYLYFEETRSVHRIVDDFVVTLGLDFSKQSYSEFESRAKLIRKDNPYRRAMRITDLNLVLM